MRISVRSSEQAWQSPDGQIKIYDVFDTEGNKWQTMSGKIANAIGQTIEVVTRTNNKGKTYLKLPTQDGYQQGPPPLPQSSPSASSSAGMSEASIARFESAVAAFGDYVDRLIGNSTSSPQSDTVPTDIPEKPLGDDFDRAIDALGGGEIVDDYQQ